MVDFMSPTQCKDMIDIANAYNWQSLDYDKFLTRDKTEIKLGRIRVHWDEYIKPIAKSIETFRTIWATGCFCSLLTLLQAKLLCITMLLTLLVL